MQAQRTYSAPNRCNAFLPDQAVSLSGTMNLQCTAQVQQWIDASARDWCIELRVLQAVRVPDRFVSRGLEFRSGKRKQSKNKIAHVGKWRIVVAKEFEGIMAILVKRKNSDDGSEDYFGAAAAAVELDGFLLVYDQQLEPRTQLARYSMDNVEYWRTS